MIYKAPDGEGVATLRFYVGAQKIAEKTGSTVTYLHQDHLGSTRLKTDSSGNKVFSSNYQPFGVDSGISGSEEFRYTGKPSDDATGLYYFGARYYDPAIGRFITEDPHSGSISDPQSLNRYVYCRNNPHKYTDPNGKFATLAAAMIGGALIGSLSKVIFYVVTETLAGRQFTGEGVLSAVTTGTITGATITLVAACGPLGGLILGAATETLNYGIDCRIKNEQVTTSGMIGHAVLGGATSYLTPSSLDMGYNIVEDIFEKPINVVAGTIWATLQDSIIDALGNTSPTPTPPQPTSIPYSENRDYIYDTSYDWVEQRRGV